MTAASDSFVDGRLHRSCLFVYQLLVIEACLLVALAPSALGVTLLAADPRNAPLYAVAAWPAGPALAAGLYAVRRLVDGNDQTPGADFLRGYRLNLVDGLKIWVPATLVLCLVLADAGATPPGPARTLLLLVAGVAALWLANVLVITARFSFRARDTTRLAAYYLGARWRCAVSLVPVGAGLVLLPDWVALLATAPALYLTALITRPVVTDVESRFVKKPE